VLVTDTYRHQQNPSDPIEKYQSVYTPHHTYACSLTNEPGKQSCSDLIHPATVAIDVAIALTGLWLGVVGHRFFGTTTFLFGTITATFIAFTVLSVETSHLSTSVRMGISIAAGLVGGLLWFLLWRRFNMNGGALVLMGLVMGFLLAALIFATPFGDIHAFTNGFNYSMAFACLAIIWPVVLLLKGRLLSIMSCAIVGSYTSLYAVDYFVGSDFDDIYSNVMKRMLSNDFAQSYSGHYFGADFNGCTNLDRNIAFLAAWVVLSMAFGALQALYTAKGIDFPNTKNNNGRSRSGAWRRQQAARQEELHSLLDGDHHIQARQAFAATDDTPPRPPPRARSTRRPSVAQPV